MYQAISALAERVESDRGGDDLLELPSGGPNDHGRVDLVHDAGERPQHRLRVGARPTGFPISRPPATTTVSAARIDPAVGDLPGDVVGFGARHAKSVLARRLARRRCFVDIGWNDVEIEASRGEQFRAAGRGRGKDKAHRTQ